MKRLDWVWGVWIASWLIPVGVWLDHTGNPLLYLTQPVPSGQVTYLVSKLLGTTVLVLLWWQAMIGLWPRIAERWLGRSRFHFHRWHGVVLMAMMLGHAICFITAASLRGKKLNLHYVGLNWGDYYETHVTLGFLALVGMVVAAAQPLMLWRRKRLAIPAMHWLALIAYFLAAWHSLSIGSETRHPVLMTEIGLMIATLALGIVLRVMPRRMRSASASGLH